MRNAIISLFIFICLLFSIYFLNNSLINLCNDIENKTAAIEDMIYDENIDDAYNSSLELLYYLNSYENINLICVNHQDFDTLKYESARLCVYISNNDLNEATASLHVIKYGASTIRNLQLINLYNIF